jgi:hypothetical protein
MVRKAVISNISVYEDIVGVRFWPGGHLGTAKAF